MEQEQERLLDEATAVVKEQAFYMKRAIDNENIRDALKHASNMICELRTSLLSPKNYYDLYMQVFQELQHLAGFFTERQRHSRKMSDLYESVQHAGNILPRLYLLITVGASYIKSKEAPAKDILKDMTELCKGVQHPMRGLFLRYYLTQMCKDKLPDTGSEYESEEGGSVNDAFDFLLTNFTEATRLWARIQHSGSAKERQRRERERHDLRVLVGANLVRLSQLEGMTRDFYADVALPKILEEMASTKDTMAQQYLLDCIIQVFSDECHLRTLDQFLSACMRVLPSVDLKPILVNLMKRLANFVSANPDAVPEGVDIFGLFRRHLNELIDRPVPAPPPATAPGATAINGPTDRGSQVDPSGLLELQVAFLTFTLTLYPERVDYVDLILGSTVTLLSRIYGSPSGPGVATNGKDKEASGGGGEGGPKRKLEGKGVDSVVELLATPLKSLSLSILEMDHYTNLMKFLNFRTRKQVAISMVRTVLAAGTPLDEPDAVQRFFSFITPLIRDEEDSPLDEEVDAEEFASEQQQVCRLIHAIRHDDTDQVFAMYTTARNAFGKGGPRRMVHTLPPTVAAALQLIPRIQQREIDAASGIEGVAPPSYTLKKVFQFVHRTCTELVSCAPEVALRLFLQAAVMANKCDAINPGSFEPICYEFVTQALVCYEEELSDSRAQFQGILMMVGTLSSHVTCLEPDNYDTLAANITQHGAKLLKKPDQCRAILVCSHLFWNNPLRRNPQRVLECLQKALKIADVAIQSSPAHVALFVEILDKYIYYYEQENHHITVSYISHLMELCNEQVTYADEDSMTEPRKNFNATLNYLKKKKAQLPPDAKYAELDLDKLSTSTLNNGVGS
mmetsp:Transcript_27160/g.67731  ORF Transcript_27160/g.67731 Transcript_27160/m.67731 type:complete len:850 (-) Transcript_27160:506-3055(-)